MLDPKVKFSLITATITVLLLSFCIVPFLVTEIRIYKIDIGMTKDEVEENIGKNYLLGKWWGSYGEGESMEYDCLYIRLSVTLRDNKVFQLTRQFCWSKSARVVKD